MFRKRIDHAATDSLRAFPLKRDIGGVLTVLSAFILGGCSTRGDGGGALDRGLQIVGLQRSQPPQSPAADAMASSIPNLPRTQRKVALRLHAGDVLNTDPRGRSLSVVVRIYQLKDKAAFERATYSTFAGAKPSQSSELAADLVDVREIVLTPGQRYDSVEALLPDARYVAVVGLFRSPADDRWRFVFDVRSAAESGVGIGVHACALSVSAGQAADVAPETMRLAGVRCPTPEPAA